MIILTISFAILTSFVCSTSFSKELTFPSKEFSVETVESGIQGVYIGKNELIAIPYEKPFILKSKYDPKGINREQKFGLLTQMQRISLDGIESAARWHGIHLSTSGLLLLNGLDILAVFINQDLQLVSRHSIVWDRILPPSDSRGEATTWEIKDFRTRFRSEWQKLDGVKFSGMALLSENKERISYLIGTRLQSASIAIMQCPRDRPSACQIKRGCNVHFLKKVEANQLTGLAFHRASNTIALLEPKQNQIHLLNYQSCYHISQKTTIFLSKKLKESTGIFIDDNSFLWITTRTPDDYNNASIFGWDYKDWSI